YPHHAGWAPAIREQEEQEDREVQDAPELDRGPGQYDPVPHVHQVGQVHPKDGGSVVEQGRGRDCGTIPDVVPSNARRVGGIAGSGPMGPREPWYDHQRPDRCTQDGPTDVPPQQEVNPHRGEQDRSDRPREDRERRSDERHGECTRSEGTRLNSSHVSISYAVFCLKKKKKKKYNKK